MVASIIVIRFLFIGPLLMVLRRRGEQAELRQSRFRAMLERLRRRADGDAQLERRQDRAERIYRRRETDIQQLKAEGFGWRGGVILSWSGMRGVVTLAAAQSLPEDIPYRSQLVLIAFTVAVVTLLLQGGTLPWVIRLSGIRGSDQVADRRELAELLDEMGAAGLAVLENPEFTLPEGEAIDDEVIARVRHDTLLSAESAWERARFGAGEENLAKSPHQQYRSLRQEVLQAERAALLDARSTGSYPSRILGRAQAMIDLEETRLEQIDNPSGS